MFKSRFQLGIRGGNFDFDKSKKFVVLHPELDSDITELAEFDPVFVHRFLSCG